MNSKLIVIAVALVAGGCNRPAELTTPDQTTSLLQPKESVQPSLLAPPAPAERGPIPPDANAAAPGTNASLAFTDSANNAAEAAKLQPSNDNSPEAQRIAVAEEEAAARAPDTAAADAAKLRAHEEYAGGRTPADALASAPVNTLPPVREETREMPSASEDRPTTSPAEPSTISPAASPNS